MTVIPLLIAMVGTALVLRLMHPVAELVDLLDKPCPRKRHLGSVPLIGGIAVFAGTAIAMLFAADLALATRLFLLSSAMMVFIGMLDDKYNLSVRIRFIGQLIAASVIIFGGDIYISNLGAIFGFGEVDMGAGGIVFTYLAILAAMNAYNMIDGIDGLLGSLGMVSFVAISVLALQNGQATIHLYSLIAACALIPFIVCNVGLSTSYRKVFMGDAGSMFVGLAVVWLLTQSTQAEYADGFVIDPVTSLWVVAVPIMDMVSIMTRRIKNGKNPARPDRDHIHHFYLNAGFSSLSTLLILTAQACLFAGVGILLNAFNAPAVVSLTLFLAAYALYCRQFGVLRKRFTVEQKRALEK